MTSPLDMAAMQTGASEQAGRDLQNQLGNVGNLNGKNISPEARAKKLREACEGFESIFIQKMWQEMRNAVPKGGLFQGREEKFWQDMYDQELSKSMTKSGGIGLADMMYEQLSKSLGDASKSTADMVAGAAFVPGAAPLVPNAPAAEPANVTEAPAGKSAGAKPVASAASIYDGEAPEAADNADEAVKNAAQATPVQAPIAPTTAQTAVQAAAFQAQAAAQSGQAGAPAAKATRAHKRVSHATGHNGDNPLELVQVARREAGDKLGSRAVRPPLRQPKNSARQAEQEAAAPQVDNRPGTPEDLKRAMSAARGAQTPEPQNSATPLADMVARVKAGQAAGLGGANVAQASNPQAEAMPVADNAANLAGNEAQNVRKVTYTTNIPKNAKVSRKGQKDAIRLLNVENAGPNSNAGKGIAAYHAQAAEAAAAKPVETAVSPAPQAQGGYAIPPLTSGDLNGNV